MKDIMGKKERFILWPTILITILILTQFVFYYNLIFIEIGLLILLFIAAFMLRGFYLMHRNEGKKSLSYFLPFLIVFFLITIHLTTGKPLMAELRNYIEFLIYDKEHDIQDYVTQHNVDYYEWQLRKGNPWHYYRIIYDKKGEIIKQDGTGDDVCSLNVSKITGYYYMVDKMCL